MWHKKEERTPEVHREYLKKLEKVKTPEDARALHKEMKKYKGGSGLPLPMRYPDAPLYISSADGRSHRNGSHLDRCKPRDKQ